MIGEGREQPTHRRGWSIGTWSTEVGTDDEHGKKAELSRETTGRTSTSRKEKKEAKEKEKEMKKEEKAVAASIDPEKDTMDPTPFREKPSRLAMLVDPKSLDDLEKIGGVEGLLVGLGVDGTKGLSVRGEKGQAVEVGDARGRVDLAGSGPEWRASMEDRRRIYGKNDLPPRKSKSLLLLMWLAFKDKVLVSLWGSFLLSLS